MKILKLFRASIVLPWFPRRALFFGEALLYAVVSYTLMIVLRFLLFDIEQSPVKLRTLFFVYWVVIEGSWFTYNMLVAPWLRAFYGHLRNGAHPWNADREACAEMWVRPPNFVRQWFIAKRDRSVIFYDAYNRVYECERSEK